MAHSVGLAVLEAIAADPDLAAAVDAAYRARQNMMVVDVAFVLASALLLTVLKLKRVRIGREGAEVDFSELQPGIVSAIRKLVAGG